MINDKKSLKYKITYFIVFILLLSALIGSYCGLYLAVKEFFKPSKVNAQEVSGSTGYLVNSAIISTGFNFDTNGFVNQDNASIQSPGILSTSMPIVFSATSYNMVLRSYYYTDDDRLTLLEYDLVIETGVDNTFTMYNDIDDTNVMYNLCFTEVDNRFSVLNSILVNIVDGSENNVLFTFTDINGYVLEAYLQPYKVDTFGSWSLNPYTQFSARYLYYTNAYFNTEEQLIAAYDEGYEYGYEVGQKRGEDIGFDKGYLKGVNDSNQYTFTGLLDAVFYAPLKAFISIFNFEILGVNVLNIVTFILTVLLFVGIIKWVI